MASTTNYIGGVVKLLENPKVLNKEIPNTEFRVQFPQKRNDIMVNLIFWGNLARDVERYYKTNDYIIIEGYISLREKKLTNSKIQKLKIVQVTVFKVYPFLLGSNRKTTKI